MDITNKVFVVIIGLSLVAMVTGTWSYDDEEEACLDPNGDNVCSRQVETSVLVMRNTTYICYGFDYQEPPCYGGYAPWRPRWRYPSYRHRGGSPSSPYRKKRDAYSTLPPPTTTNYWDWDSWWYTTTSPTTTTTAQWYDDDDSDSDDSDSDDSDSSPYDDWWGDVPDETPSPGRCCRRVQRVCWRIILACVKKFVDQYYCCPGYKVDGEGGCEIDIHCSEDNGGCEQMCLSDEMTGHHCGCLDGYELVDDTQCVDIDECAVNNGGCDHGCVNTDGSFYCTCRTGYELTSRSNCTEINECTGSNGGCDQLCHNTEGGHYCSCQKGFVLYNGSRCDDLDECLVNKGGCSHTCENEFGGYACVCPEGYNLDDEGFTCLTEDDSAEEVPSTHPAIPVIPAEPRTASLTEKFFKPIPIVCLCIGLVVLCILLGLICYCRCRKRAPPPQAVPIYVVGKVAKVPIAGVEASGGKPLPDVDLDLAIFDIPEDIEFKGGNIYNNPPALKKGPGSLPPSYDELLDTEGYEQPIPYEQAIKQIRPRYEVPAPQGNPDQSEIYSNLAFEADNQVRPHRPQGNGDSYENVPQGMFKPYADAIKHLKGTGVLNKD